MIEHDTSSLLEVTELFASAFYGCEGNTLESINAGINALAQAGLLAPAGSDVRRDALREAARIAEGWECQAGGNDYQTNGNGRFWDADTIYHQGRMDAAAQILALLDQPAAAPAPVSVPDGWMPIETAPRDGTELLLWFRWESLGLRPDGTPYGGVFHAKWWWPDDGEDGWVDPHDFERIGDNPTMWHSAPAPPRAGMGEG